MTRLSTDPSTSASPPASGGISVFLCTNLGTYPSGEIRAQLNAPDFTGPTGPTGAQGPVGPAGAKGDTSPAGRDATATCKVKRKKGQPKVTCTVKLARR